MELIVAETAGFCFGVKRGVECVYEKIKEGKIYTYGPIIHNKNVTRDLQQKGVEIIENFDNISDGTIIIRSHGVPKSVYEELKSKGLKYEDCTCPYVKKIHSLVEKDYNKGNQIIIVGSKEHPEIVGINGWCENTAIIIEKSEELISYSFDKTKKFTIVVQTTFRNEVFNKIIDDIKILNLDINIYNTICSATTKRQDEAEKISKNVDHMVIIGDKSSSNTKKLYEISKKYCKKSYLIETVGDLVLNIFSANDRIGITAGASTPSAIIKEAVVAMSENQTFEEMLNESFVTLHTGDVVKGIVISVSNNEISVNLGYKSDGVITRAEYSEDPNCELTKEVKPNDEIQVYVVRVNDGDGNVVLSKKRLDAQKGYEVIEEAHKTGEPIKGKVVDVVKGGLMALVNGIKVFVPSSQISARYVEKLDSFKGKEFDFNIIEFDRSKRRIIAGRKDLAVKEEKSKKEEIYGNLEVGKKVEGTVSRIVDFGAFVDLGGVDGLIHISEMSWGRVKKASDVVKEGDKVTCYVLEADKAKGKISLSLKDVSANPWNGAEERFAVGTILDGKVVRMVPFGAFVELSDGVDGLVHISQISAKHVVKPEDELKIGEIIKVKITELDVAAKKISLSKKDAEGTLETEEVSEETTI